MNILRTTNSGLENGEYYTILIYFGKEVKNEWTFSIPAKTKLPDGTQYNTEIIDTWNMTITPVEEIFTTAKKDTYRISDATEKKISLPGKPYMAIRLKKVLPLGEAHK